MEKINNYTPGPWSLVRNNDGTLEEGMAGTNRITGVKSDAGFGEVAMVIYKKTNILGDSKALQYQTFEANAQLIALAPTLYEQHFKMLELLKGDLYFIKIELKERLKFSDVNTDDKTKAISDRIKELEQTIKECEL